MRELHTLTKLPTRQKVQRVGRGVGSGRGKTSCRGQKGAGARSGYTRRHGNEGGNLRFFQKVPTRGFTRGGLQQKLDAVNLFHLEKLFEDGETVALETLIEKGLLGTKSYGFKVLGEGELTKKVTIVADNYSKSAMEKLQKAGIPFRLADEDVS